MPLAREVKPAAGGACALGYAATVAEPIERMMRLMVMRVRSAPALLPLLLAASCTGPTAHTSSASKARANVNRAAKVCEQHFVDVRFTADSQAGYLRYLGPHPTPGPNAPKGNFSTLADNVYVALCLVGASSSTEFDVYGVPTGMSPTHLWTQNVSDRLTFPG